MQIQTTTHLFFWQHDSIYSNWYHSPHIVIPDGDRLIEFDNSEALFMYLKALQFNDTTIADQIISNQYPASVKKLGRLIKGFDQTIWDSVREELMFIACWNKFSQNPILLAELLSTGQLILVEASPFDRIWGIGLAPNDPKVHDSANWKGLNLLGKVLMKVRDSFSYYML